MPRIHCFTNIAKLIEIFFGKSIDGQLLCARKFWKRWEAQLLSTDFLPLNSTNIWCLSNSLECQTMLSFHWLTQALEHLALFWIWMKSRDVQNISWREWFVFVVWQLATLRLQYQWKTMWTHLASGYWWFEENRNEWKSQTLIVVVAVVICVCLFICVVVFVLFIEYNVYSSGPPLFIKMCHLFLFCTECDMKLSILILWTQNEIFYMFWWWAIEHAWKFGFFGFFNQ